MLAKNRGGCGCDTEPGGLCNYDACDGVVARIRRHDKRPGEHSSHHGDPQPAMRQRLVMKCHRRALDDRAHRDGELDGRQLPQPAE
jgi:hypothetical protein